MLLYMYNDWFLFCITFGLMLFVTLIRNVQSKYFFTNDVVERKFNIVDLTLAAAPAELVNIIKGLYVLPAAKSKKAVNAVKTRLYIDFLFMPCAYLSVFILCTKVADRIQFPLGYYVFIVLAWLQLVSWLFHIIENVFLLSKINPNPAVPGVAACKRYLKMEAAKWGIVLTGAVCSVSAICYFWLTGHYSPYSLHYILIVSAEITVFMISRFFLIKEKGIAGKPVENL